jgi:TonB family protein
MSSRRKNRTARAVVAVALALGAHAVVITLWTLFADVMPLPLKSGARQVSSHNGPEAQPREDDDRPMEIETIVNQLDRPDEKTAEEKKREEEAKKQEDQKNPNGQVVDIARPLIESRPDKADFVAEYDSKVDKQTRGPHGRDQAGGQSSFIPPTGMPDSKTLTPLPPSGPQQKAGAESRPGRPGPLAMRDLEKRRTQSSGDGPQATKDGELEHAGSDGHAQQQPAPRAQGEGGNQGQPAMGGRAEAPLGLPGERKPNLTPSTDSLQKAIGKGAGSMDYLKDIDDGEMTAVNAKKWKHAPFFNRVKRAVANEWHPEVVYVRHDPSGNVYGVKDRVTVLRIHLQTDGKLAAWNVIQSSGVEFLDDEAIDAFRKAAPFPNVPKDLADTDGQVHFNFAFIFELSGRGNVKIYKYQ